MVLAYIEKGSLARGGGGGGREEGRRVLIDVMLLQESFAYKNNLHLRGNDFNTRQIGVSRHLLKPWSKGLNMIEKLVKSRNSFIIVVRY